MRARVLIVGTLARVPSEGLPLAIVLAVADRDGSTAFAGLLLALTTLPQIVTGLAGGALLDRAARPDRVLGGAVIVTAAALGLLAATSARGPGAIAAALMLAAADPVLTGGLSALFTRWADSAPGAAIAAMSAVDGVAYNVAGVAGPLLVTVVAAMASPAVAVWVLAALIVPSAVVVLGGPRLTPAPHAGPRVVAALQAIWADRPLRGVTVASTLEMGALGGLTIAMVAAAASHGHAAAAAGAVLTVRAVAALAGSLAMTRWGHGIAPHRLVIGSIAASGVGLVAMGGAPWWLLVGVGGLVGLADGPVLVGTYRARADGSPPSVRASVFTVAASLKLGASSAGAVVAGLAIGERSTAAGLAAIGVAVLGAAALGGLAARLPSTAER